MTTFFQCLDNAVSGGVLAKKDAEQLTPQIDAAL